MGIAANEGAKFWLSIMNNLRNRGVEDILIAVVDGPKSFPDSQRHRDANSERQRSISKVRRLNPRHGHCQRKIFIA
jgi:transposase-like protein